ncbi:unnamed protein product [Cladocopium goreaui]|uniref:Uncharacterized protein n=1 Tax=Cladocopium goreaui TaxID=2562237 RepID=A0A9P1CZK9_9DINO|nr:unnamed protein product [Cladocopium goreaui]
MYQPIYSIYYICTPLVYCIYTLNIIYCFLFIIYLPLHACLKLFVSDCWRQTYDYYEFYAGVGNITRQARSCGYKALRFDILDNKKPTNRKSNFMDLASPSGWALAVVALLRAKIGNSPAHFAMKCSSLCRMNIGTSRRGPCCSLGFHEYPSVLLSNKLLERTCCLVLLATALGAAWTLEQPDGSVLEFYPAWRTVMQSIFAIGGPRAVCKVKWWMQHYSAKTPKRHYGYANTRAVMELDRGKLTKDQRKPRHERIKTADAYYDKHGVRRYKGNANLRPTEIYPMPFARRLVDLLEPMKETAKGSPVAPVPTPKAVETFNQWPEVNPADWSFADFGEMFAYLRGNRHLIIPEEWRGTIPDRL